MKVGLFIPCYIDQFYPSVGIASLQLLQKLGCDVVVPPGQTCCGQPMANSGFARLARGCDRNFIRCFAALDYIVCPSGSCVLHIKEHLSGEEPAAAAIRARTLELTEFLLDVLQVNQLEAHFPHRVSLQVSCHGQRGLGLSSMSERMEQPFSKAEQLLQLVKGVEFVKTDRWDECCGFGGTFCVQEEAVSVKMGVDRVAEHEKNQVSYITGGDMSCLMHLQGILQRKASPVQVIHIAEILNHT